MQCKKLAIIGGGGHAKEVIEVAELSNYEISGIFAKESSISKYPYLGYIDELIKLKNEFDCIHIAIGAVNKDGIINRKKIIDFLKNEGFTFATLISPNAHVSESAKIGKGLYISHFSLVSSDARIGDNTILNYNSVIAHDSIIGNNVIMSPKSFAGGNSKVKNNTLIGAGALILQGCTVGENCIVGMGAVVRKNIEDNFLVFGNPLRKKYLD